MIDLTIDCTHCDAPFLWDSVDVPNTLDIDGMLKSAGWTRDDNDEPLCPECKKEQDETPFELPVDMLLRQMGAPELPFAA